MNITNLLRWVTTNPYHVAIGAALVMAGYFVGGGPGPVNDWVHAHTATISAVTTLAGLVGTLFLPAARRPDPPAPK